MHVQDAGGTGAVARHFLDEDRKGHVTESRAAVGFGDEDPEQSELRGFRDQIARKIIGVIDRRRTRLDLALSELPHQSTNLLLLRTQREVHVLRCGERE